MSKQTPLLESDLSFRSMSNLEVWKFKRQLKDLRVLDAAVLRGTSIVLAASDFEFEILLNVALRNSLRFARVVLDAEVPVGTIVGV